MECDRLTERYIHVCVCTLRQEPSQFRAIHLPITILLQLKFDLVSSRCQIYVQLLLKNALHLHVLLYAQMMHDERTIGNGNRDLMSVLTIQPLSFQT